MSHSLQSSTGERAATGIRTVPMGRYLFARLATVLREDMVVIADPGDAFFGATDLPIRRGTGLLSPAYDALLGFAVPASLAKQV